MWVTYIAVFRSRKMFFTFRSYYFQKIVTKNKIEKICLNEKMICSINIECINNNFMYINLWNINQVDIARTFISSNRFCCIFDVWLQMQIHAKHLLIVEMGRRIIFIYANEYMREKSKLSSMHSSLVWIWEIDTATNSEATRKNIMTSFNRARRGDSDTKLLINYFTTKILVISSQLETPEPFKHINNSFRNAIAIK